jgi:hypothetical protein
MTGMNETLLFAPDESLLDPWELSDEKQKIWRKEVIYAGDFVKDRGKAGDLRFSVDEKRLHHWKNTFDKMMHEGIEVPIPLEHTTDPRAKQGTAVGFEVDKNKRGIPALFMLSRFVDDAAEKIGTRTNVSLFAPPKFKSGIGTEYVQPIRHVALTDYPVIPGLEGWQKLALSYGIEPDDEPIILHGEGMHDQKSHGGGGGGGTGKTASSKKAASKNSKTSSGRSMGELKKIDKEITARRQELRKLPNKELEKLAGVAVGKKSLGKEIVLKKVIKKEFSKKYDDFDAIDQDIYDHEIGLSYDEPSIYDLLGLSHEELILRHETDEEEDMTILQLAQTLGLQATDDATAEQAIVAAFNGMKQKLMPKPPAAPGQPPAAPPAAAPRMQFSNAQVSMLRENRGLKLSQLVEKAGVITPAVRDDLAALFVDDDSLELSLGTPNDEEDYVGELFDKVCLALSKNARVMPDTSGRGKTGSQSTRKLEKGKGEEQNSLVLSAQQRAKAARERSAATR